MGGDKKLDKRFINALEVCGSHCLHTTLSHPKEYFPCPQTTRRPAHYFSLFLTSPRHCRIFALETVSGERMRKGTGPA